MSYYRASRILNVFIRSKPKTNPPRTLTDMTLRGSVRSTNDPVLHDGTKRSVLLAKNLRTRRADRDGLNVNAYRRRALNSAIFLRTGVEQPCPKP